MKKEVENLKEYKYGFTTDVENIRAPKGLNEDTIKFISNIKKEPKWMLEWRLKAFKRLKNLKEPNWQKPKYPKIDYQDLYYYSAPKNASTKPKNLKDLDPKILETYKKLGIPLEEQKRLIAWSRTRHLELKQANRFIFPLVQTILLIQCRSRTQNLCIIRTTNNRTYLKYLPPEMWFTILQRLTCGDFGPRQGQDSLQDL